jgi:hypothetical protein
VTIPLLYMIRLDGFGFSRFGTHGLLWMDELDGSVFPQYLGCPLLRMWTSRLSVVTAR